MNQRLPRFALIALMLLTLVAVQMTGDIATPKLLAQGSTCGSEGSPIAESLGPLATPDPDTDPWVIYRSETVSDDLNDLVPETKTLVVRINGGVTFDPGPLTGSSVIEINSGTVTVEACAGTTLAIQDGEASELRLVAPGSRETLQPGSTIFVPAYGSYQILNAEGSASATFTLVGQGTFVLRKLCGGAGC